MRAVQAWDLIGISSPGSVHSPECCGKWRQEDHRDLLAASLAPGLLRDRNKTEHLVFSSGTGEDTRTTYPPHPHLEFKVNHSFIRSWRLALRYKRHAHNNSNKQTGEMTPPLGEWIDLSLVLGTYIRWLTTTGNSGFRRSDTPGLRPDICAHTQSLHHTSYN